MSRIKKFAFAVLAGVFASLLPATAATLGTPWEIDVNDSDYGFDLWKSPSPNAIALWGEEDEMVAIPITDIGDDEELIPLVVYASATAKDVGPASIKTDQWLYNKYITNARRWFAEAKAEGDLDDPDMTFDEWLQDSDLNWQSEPWTELWSAGAPDATRKWLCVPMKDVEWGSFRSLMVGLKGAPPSSFKIVYIGWEAELPAQLADLVGLGIKSTFEVGSYDHYGDSSCLWLDAEKKVGTLTITTPSAGRLVLAGPAYYGDALEEGGLTVTSPKLASPIDISLRYDDWEGALNDIVVDVSAATTVTITVTDSAEEDAELSLEGIAFYRSDKPSVSVRAVGTSEVVWLEGEEYGVGLESPVGYAKGGNTYVAGDTVTLTAVPASGEVFDRWVVDCELPAGTDLTSPTLKFKVTNAMVGTVDDQKTILAIATWKPRYDVFVLSDPAGAGTVSGGGKYVAGQTVTLSAVAGKGCTFTDWSDGVKSATRTFTVGEEAVVLTARFEAPNGVRNLGEPAVMFNANGGEVSELVRCAGKKAAIGALPVPTRAEFTFDGWYTAASGGTKITSSTTVSANTTFYAHWSSALWTLDRSGEMPGEFWTLTSPDGKWQFYCAPTHEYDEQFAVYLGDDDLHWNEGEYTQNPEIAIASEYWFPDEDGDGWDSCEVYDFTGGRQESAYIKGSGVLTLPTVAVDPVTGEKFSVGVGEWSLEGWEAKTDAITKIIVPAGYDKAYGVGNSLKLAQGYEVEEGNGVYYSKDGVLYRYAYARPQHDTSTGDWGDELMQFPSGKTGSFTIPDGVTKVRSGAFEKVALSSLTIGPDLARFSPDHDANVKGITINANERITCTNGILADNFGKRAVLVLWSQLAGKDIVVPPEIEEVGACVFGYKSAKSIKFSSPDLTVQDEAFEELTLSGNLDFSEVGHLVITGLLSDESSIPRIILPVDVEFPTMDDEYYGEQEVLDLGDDVEKSVDIIWPTSDSREDSGLDHVSFEGKNKRITATLHVRADAGDWPSELGAAAVKKDVYVVSFGESPRYVLSGEAIGTLPVPTQEGYRFDGWYTAESGGSKIATTTKITANTTYYARWSAAIVPSVMEGCEAMGKVSGGGVVAQGKTTTVKATANKNYAFAGWYDSDGDPLVGEYRSPSYVYTSTGEPTALYASFVSADDDADSLSLDEVDGLDLTAEADGSLSATLDVPSYSLPTVTVTGLPAGLKFDAKALTISGKATTPGAYTVAVKATNASVAAKNAKTASFTIRVPNLETDKIVGLSPDMEAYGFVAGVAFDGDEITPAAAEGYTLSVSGLPSGLKYNSKTGEITGTPTAKAGSYTVTFTATPSAALKKQGAVAEKATITIAISYPVLKIEKWLETADVPESLDENALFKVTGAGSYAANKVVSLSATAPKGYVFVGWRWNDEPLDNQKQDYRTASGYKYTMSAEDVTIGAYFRPLSEDWAYVNVDPDLMLDLTQGDEFEYDLTEFISSASLPTVTVSGLPSGIKYNAATHMLSGKPTDKTAKWYDIRISVKNAGGYTASAVIGASVNGGEPAEKDEIGLFDALAELDNLLVGDDEEDWEAPIPSNLKATVKNLPPGLELEREEQEVDDVLCDSILGTPTKGGVYYLTVTCKDPENARKTLTTVKRVVVRDPGSRYVTVEAAAGGTASGSGIYAAGATLKAVAKASKGFVFSHWMDDDGEVILNEDADYRQPTFSCIVGSGLPSVITAQFVSNDEDAGISINQYAKTGEYDEENEPIYACVDEPWDYDCENPWKKFVFVVSSASLPKITVKGLPSGMTFSGESSIETIVAEPEPGAEMYGELCSYRIRVADATKLQPGEHAFTITAKNVSGASATETFTVRVPNLETDKIEGLAPDMEAYRFVAGVPFDGTEIAPVAAEGYTLSVSGLPSGLKYNSKTGEITGTPTAKEGSYTVTFTATPSAALKKQGAVAEKATITITITYPKLTLVPEVAEGLDPAIDATAVKFTLSGAGSYAAGKKVTIKATAPAGWLFGEWQLDGETYSQAASETFTMGEDDAALTAVFLHQSQDWLDFSGPVDEALNEAGYLELDLAVGNGFVASAAGDLFDSGTAATYTAKGLPTGLKFDTKTGAITGTATKAGRFYATVTAKNASGFTRTLLAKINVGDVEEEPDPEGPFARLPALSVGDYYDIYLSSKWNGEGYQSCSGLPTGLKVVSEDDMDGMSYYAVGYATTPGWFTFVLTEKYEGQTKKSTYVLPVVDIPARYEFISCDAAEGTVTGGGVWAGGSTHTIKATPRAGYVFAGYFRDADFQEPATEAIVEESEWGYESWTSRGCEADYRNASLTWVVGRHAPERLYARFIPKSEATGETTILVKLDDDEDENFVPMAGESDLPYTWDVQPAEKEYGEMALRFESDTLPTVAVTGLPKGFSFSGLAYDGQARIEYNLYTVGARAEPGDYNVTITTKNQGTTQATTFILHIGQYRSWCTEWLSESYELLSFVSPDDWLADIFGAEGGLAPTSETSDWGSSSTTWSVTGLPAGLSFNAKTGKITGTLKAVSQPTTYIVHFTCTEKSSIPGSGSWSYVYDGTCAVTVCPIYSWAVGTYDGMMHWVGMDGDWESPGSLQVTVAANGKVTVDYVRIHPTGKGTEKDTFTALITGYDDEDESFTFEIDLEDDEYWERGVGRISREALDGENMDLGYCAWVEIETEGEDDDEDEFNSHHIAFKDVSADSALVPLFAQMEDFEWDLEIEEYPMNEHLQDETHLVVGNLGLLFGADGKVTLDWESYNEEVESISVMPARLVFTEREADCYWARIEANVYEKGSGRDPGENRLIGISLELWIPCDGSVLDLENLETVVSEVIVDDEWDWGD